MNMPRGSGKTHLARLIKELFGAAVFSGMKHYRGDFPSIHDPDTQFRGCNVIVVDEAQALDTSTLLRIIECDNYDQNIILLGTY